MFAHVANDGLGTRSQRVFQLSPVTVGFILALIEFVAIFGIGVIVYTLYVDAVPQYFSFYSKASLGVALSATGLFYLSGLYKLESIEQPRQAYRTAFLNLSTAFCSLLVGVFLLKISIDYSRIWYLIFGVSSVLFVCLFRGGCARIVRRLARHDRVVRRIAIVGGGKQGARLIERIRNSGLPWVRVVCIVDDRADRTRLDTPAEITICGNTDALIEYARNHRVDDVIVALPWSAEERFMAILNKLSVLPVNVGLCPDGVGFNMMPRGYYGFAGLPILTFQNRPFSGLGWIIKELSDKILGVLILVLSAPVLAIIAILVKLDSPGPVLFRQTRYGFNHKLINVYKFRTMYIHQQDSNAEQLTTRNDPRITPIGAVLRRYSLDELPQLFNVVMGNMSLVGPRPHALAAKAAGKLYEEQVAQYAARHRVKPGITGWAQVNGWRGETDREEQIQKRVEYDLQYIDQWTPLLDLEILVRTIFEVFFSKTAF